MFETQSNVYLYRKVAEFVRELIKIYQILKVNILHAVNLLQHEDILNQAHFELSTRVFLSLYAYWENS